MDDLVTDIQTHTETHTHKSKGKVVPLLLDVCKSEMIEAAVGEVERRLKEEGKKLGALVNNAGIGMCVCECVCVCVLGSFSFMLMKTHTHIYIHVPTYIK